MNARIEKKLSKRLFDIAPALFNNVWIDAETHTPCVGGESDYWGEAQDEHTLWQWFKMNWCWLVDFPTYPKGHEFEHYPDTDGFKPTTKNLIRLAASCNT